MKTNFDNDELEEAEEMQELSPEEARRLGLPVEQTPEEMLAEMEANLERMRDGGPTDEEIKMAIRERMFPKEPAETHEELDAIPTLQEEEDMDPCPDFIDDGVSLSSEQEEILNEWWERRSKRRHDIFIKEMIAHGNRRIAYQAAYPGVKDMTAKVNACRLMANPEISTKVREGIIAKQKEEEEMVKAVYAGQLAAINEKRAILAKLMRGELLLEKEITQNGATTILKQKPDFKDILKAIVVNKMENQWLSNIALPDSGY